MLNRILRRVVGAAVVAGSAAVAAAGARYSMSKRINAAERLGEALLHSGSLREALELSPSEAESALVACAAYMVTAAYDAADGMAGPPQLDAIGFERTVMARDGVGRARIVTTSHQPEARWQFDVEIEGVAKLTGSRRLVTSRLTGPRTRLRTPDTVSIRFDNSYFATIESDLEYSEALLPAPGSRGQLTGTASLSDNRGNVGRITIEPTGIVTGSVTRGSDTIGRIDGTLREGITFHQYVGA